MCTVSIEGNWNAKGTLPIVCPACRRTTHESIAKLQQSKLLVCPSCGKTTQCTSDFLAAIKAL
ncbi:MAG: YnfU family zinc-binding protein [Casimicrobiaceae bacterium]